MNRTWKSASRRRVTRPRLQVERLEDRSLLAVAAFTVNLYQDAGGIPGELIADDTLDVGESFFVEIIAREYDPLAAGLRAVALDISWDPAVLTEIDTPFDPSKLVTPDLPALPSGTLDNEAGSIQNLGGSAFLSSNVGRAIGNLAPERFALLNFRAIQPAESSPLTLRQGGSRIVTVPTQTLRSSAIYFEPQTITVSPGAAPAASLGDAGVLSGNSLTQSPDGPVESVVREVPPDSPPDSGSATADGVPTGAIVGAAAPSAGDGLPQIGDGSNEMDRRDSTSFPTRRNPANPLDVDASQQVTPIDALIVINYLDANPGRWALPEDQVTQPPFYDVNGDAQCTPHDALLVINFIGTQQGPEAEGEQTTPDLLPAATEATVPQLPPSTAPVCTSATVQPELQVPLTNSITPIRPPFAGPAEKESAAKFSTAATDALFRTRRVAEEAWTDLEDILPAIAAAWVRAA